MSCWQMLRQGVRVRLVTLMAVMLGPVAAWGVPLPQPSGPVCCLNPFPHVHRLTSATTTDFSVGGGLNLTTANASPFEINIIPGPGLAANPDALASFERAADQWREVILTPMTVTIEADFAPIGDPNVVGQTAHVALEGGYNLIRDQLVASAAGDPNRQIIQHLPTASEFSAFGPSSPLGGPNGSVLSSPLQLRATKANLKAIGFTGLDDIDDGTGQPIGPRDGSITFNSNFDFTLDNSGGVAPGTVDFESAAAHEIGHILGFTSIVDDVDVQMALNEILIALEEDPETIVISPYLLDLYRFPDLERPGDTNEFRNFPRELTPGWEAVLADLENEWLMSTGQFNGDGRQASHWKDDDLTGILIGMMDPTINFQEIWSITEADFRAMGLIGYSVIPEPAAIALLAMTGLLLMRRRQSAV